VRGFFAHRARAAFLAICLRRLGLSLAARAFPPFSPPSRPKATAAGFFPGFFDLGFGGLSVALDTMEAASSLGSVGGILERLGIASILPQPGYNTVVANSMLDRKHAVGVPYTLGLHNFSLAPVLPILRVYTRRSLLRRSPRAWKNPLCPWRLAWPTTRSFFG